MTMFNLPRSADVKGPAAIRNNMRISLTVLGVLVLALIALATVVQITGAIIAPGRVAVASELKKVQHPTGGIVAEIRVRNGSRVKAGDVLLALDPTTAGAAATIVDSTVDDLLVRQERLEAERDSRPMRLSPEIAARQHEPRLASLIRDEQRLFALRAGARAGQKEQLREQIKGYQDQIASRDAQYELIEPELVAVRSLYERGLVPLTRLNALERSAVQLQGDTSQFRSTIAETRGKLIQIDQDARSEAGRELTDVQNRLAEFRQRKVATDDEFSRILIRAPQDGVVDQLNVHTIGGVIAPGEAILFIVPDKDELTIEAQVRPADVDQVRAGQPVNLRFSAFSAQTTPELKGTVSRISADVHSDERTGAVYYTASIVLTKEQLSRLGSLTLVPGMPVEAFIQTGSRSMLSFLTKPLADQVNRSFREG